MINGNSGGYLKAAKNKNMFTNVDTEVKQGGANMAGNENLKNILLNKNRNGQNNLQILSGSQLVANPLALAGQSGVSNNNR